MRGRQSSVSNPDVWQIHASQSLFRDPHVEVVQERVTVPGETRTRTWTVVRRKCAVVVAPITGEGRVVLIRQARIPVRQILWEFPAGQVDDGGRGFVSATGTDDVSDVVRGRGPKSEAVPSIISTLEATALRELVEETGYELIEGGGLTSLGHYYPSQGFTNETNYLFIAQPVAPGRDGHRHDPSESIVDCREFTLEELGSMIAKCIVQDANTLALYARMAACGLVP
jgi:ADP-ribose diphosphatase